GVVRKKLPTALSQDPAPVRSYAGAREISPEAGRSVELTARPSEQRQGLFDIVGNERRAEQIFGSPLVARTSCLEPQLAPVFNTAVAASEPHQRDQVDLLF